MPNPNRRPLDFQTFDQLTADVAVLRQRGYDKVGNWSLEQILDHLTKTMLQTLDAQKGLPRPVRWLMKPIIANLLRTRKMPTVPAPKSVRPGPTVEPGVEDRFADAIRRSAALTGDRIDHPAFGWMSVHDWQQLQLIHAGRHLSFLIPK